MNAYQQRNALLREMGYPTYADYLASDLWQTIRRRVLAAHRYNCGLCSGRAVQVHHIRYTREAILGQGITHFVPVCRSCHERHEVQNCYKVTIDQCNEAMRRTFFAKMAQKRKNRQPTRKQNIAARAAIRQRRK